MRKVLFTTLMLLGMYTSYAQDEKITIAILPFINSSGSSNTYAGLVQEMITKEFIKSSRFTILDRSKFQRVMDELKIQKSEEFLNSRIVEQGKQSGAQYLVTGTLTEFDSKQETTRSYDYSSKQTITRTAWKANISFSFQVIDVESGKAIYAENIRGNNGASHEFSQNDAMDNAQCKVNRQVKSAVMKQFPEEIVIVKVEKTTKKGLPDEVLISAGTNFFDENYKKGNECDNGIEKIFKFGKKESIKLKVVEIEILNVNGKESKREKIIGKLKLKEVQGEFSVCEVDDGAEEIQAKLNANQKLLLKIL